MSSNEGFSEDFKRIQADYIKELPAKLAEMDQLLSQLKSAPTSEIVMNFRNHVHKIAGNAATFGFQKATDLCKEWDLKLKEIAEQYNLEKLKAILPALDPFMQNLKGTFNVK